MLRGQEAGRASPLASLSQGQSWAEAKHHLASWFQRFMSHSQKLSPSDKKKKKKKWFLVKNNHPVKF